MHGLWYKINLTVNISVMAETRPVHLQAYWDSKLVRN
nr:MAG TPA: hypothetical protein [Caudoviricetes sp.]